MDRKAMCLAYKEVKIGSVTNTLNWRDKNVIVFKWSLSQLTIVFGD